MKVSAFVLAAVATAVLSSCEKSDVKPDNSGATPEQPSGTVPNDNPNNHPDACLGCGMG